MQATAPPVGSFERVGTVSSSLSEQGFGNKHWTVLKSWGDLAPVLYGGTCALYFPLKSPVGSETVLGQAIEIYSVEQPGGRG